MVRAQVPLPRNPSPPDTSPNRSHTAPAHSTAYSAPAIGSWPVRIGAAKDGIGHMRWRARVIGLTRQAAGPVRARAERPGQNTDRPVSVVNLSRAATPATELPRSSRPGLHTHSVQRPGTTAMMPPPTPLLPGRPTR